MLQKGVYPYEYMDDWEKFNETSLPEEEDFYSHLNIEDINDAHYAHAKQACEDFEIKNLWQYHDLHAYSNTLLLIYLRTLEICVLIHISLILQSFF